METHTASAGFTIAVGLFVWAVSGSNPASTLCGDPVERESLAGHTTVVACDGSSAAHTPLRGPARRLFGHPVDLNCSDPLTLQTLAGIGPARAKAIVDERGHGRYEEVDDLTRVRGIGPKTLARLRAELVVRQGHGPVDSRGCGMNSSTNSRKLDRYEHPTAPS